MENKDILEYKNFWLFYKNLYTRLFKVINNIIDENHYNIRKLKDELNDFLDSYSYYILKKKLITKDEEKETDKKILENLKGFDSFTETLNEFPSKEFNKIRLELTNTNPKYDISKLSMTNYTKLLQEYYSFFNQLILIIKNFIDITALNGFLPNIKSKSSLKTIGYANYDLFFTELEALKLKMSELTSTIRLNNIFKSRRCVLSVLVIFSPYFTKIEICNQLSKKLNYAFIEDEEILDKLKKSYNYDSFLSMSKEMQKDLLETIITPLRENVSLIKRYISYEFGERDMSPRIKRKYAYDPVGV